MKMKTIIPAIITLLLSASNVADAATRTWTGAGPNNFWTNAANWGGTAPVAGDDLVFPVGAARPSSINNISGLAVNRIQFDTNGYAFSGNALTVLGGINATNLVGVNALSLDLIFSGTQGITNAGTGGLSLSGSNSVSGTLNLFGSGTILFLGTVAGTGGLVCNSGNGVVLNNANSYSGATEVTGGSLAIGYSTSLGSAAGGTTVRAGAELDISANVTTTEPLLLEGTLYNGDDSNVWSGPITLSGANAEIFVTAGTLTVSGVISGTGSVTTRNFEALRFTGANTYTGDTTIADGTLIVDGQQPSSRVVLAGGTLGGSGRVGQIIETTGGTVSPGASPGILTSSNVVFGSGTTFRVEINGTTAGTGYDQLAVKGSATLGGGLQVSNTISPTVGATFRILDNDGIEAVTNTFAGLPEGAIVTSGGQTFSLSYKGGTGNDVVLTCRCLNPCNLRLHDGPTPYEVYIRWEPPVGAVGEYIIYRNGLEVQRYPASTFLSFPLYYDKFLQPSHSYTYQVIATFTNGAPPQSSNPLLVVTPPPTPVVGTNKVVSLLLQFADYVQEPYSTNYVNGVMFTNPFSVAAFYREISYGKYTLEGSTYGWFVLPGFASNYCTIYNPVSGLWFGPNMSLIVQDALNVVPPAVSNLLVTADIAQYIVNGLGTAGLSGGRTKLYSATNGFGFGSCIHEISHGINNYGHSGGWLYLPGGYSAGPSLADLHSGGCFTSAYSDSYDPLGDASSYHHHTWFKERAGWLPTNNVQWIDHDGLYQVWAIEQNTNQVQMLKFDLGNEMFYFFEYRTLTGFDGPSTPAFNRPPIDAVLGRLRLSYSQETGDIETMIPYPLPLFVPQVMNPGTPFLEPYRNLRVEVVSKSGGVATLRVNGTTNVFRVTNVRKLGATGQNVELTFNSLQGAKYIAQATADFTSWQTVQTNILAPTNTTIATLTNAVTLPNRFFRIGVDNGLP